MIVTDIAADKIKEVRIEDKFLRICVRGGGCSGFQYKMGWDDKQPDDYVHDIIVIDTKSSIYLMGAELDYVEGLMGAGFKINNPNAKSTCGCGESFAV
jgi:iron-sulfur cluster assembly accessory protein